MLPSGSRVVPPTRDDARQRLEAAEEIGIERPPLVGRLAYRGGTVICSVSRLSDRKPGSTESTDTKLRSSRPAPRSAPPPARLPTTTSAARRRRCARLTVEPRPDSFNVDCTCGRDAANAGTRPISVPVSSESPKVNATSTAGSATSSIRGISGGASARSAAMPEFTHEHERRDASDERQQHGLDEGLRERGGAGRRRARIGWPSPAGAPLLRASSRLARFTHAISSTNPTPPSQEQQRRTDAADGLLVQREPRSRRQRGWCREKPRPAAARCRRPPPVACRTVTPGFRRPTTDRKRAARRERGHPRRRAIVLTNCSGSQASTS